MSFFVGIADMVASAKSPGCGTFPIKKSQPHPDKRAYSSPQRAAG
jgi:hypothetical protein